MHSCETTGYPAPDRLARRSSPRRALEDPHPGAERGVGAGVGDDWTGRLGEDENEQARIAITTFGFRGIEQVYGPRCGPTGDAAFDERFGVWANEAARTTLERLGPDVRRLFVDCHPHVEAYQGGGRAWFRFGARLERAHLEAAAGIVAGLWPTVA